MVHGFGQNIPHPEKICESEKFLSAPPPVVVFLVLNKLSYKNQCCVAGHFFAAAAAPKRYKNTENKETISTI